MYQIVKRKELNVEVTLMEIAAPLIARKAKPGQFIILRIDENGERIPLTIADTQKEEGTVTIIFQKVGKTTHQLGELQEGDGILDFVGPLGKASETEGYQSVCVIGGGLGVAIGYPQAKSLFHSGVNVDVINGFRHKDLVILKEEFEAIADKLYITTDDGSLGFQGFVSEQLEILLSQGKVYDLIIAIGPLPMMNAVVQVAKKHQIKTLVSMNSIMLDGTGMCGACRLSVGGKTKFACVDGPDFDGEKVDFKEAMVRGAMYQKAEKESMGQHQCNLLKGGA